jgi:hypothetical protein
MKEMLNPLIRLVIKSKYGVDGNVAKLFLKYLLCFVFKCDEHLYMNYEMLEGSFMNQNAINWKFWLIMVSIKLFLYTGNLWTLRGTLWT